MTERPRDRGWPPSRGARCSSGLVSREDLAEALIVHRVREAQEARRTKRPVRVTPPRPVRMRRMLPVREKRSGAETPGAGRTSANDREERPQLAVEVVGLGSATLAAASRAARPSVRLRRRDRRRTHARIKHFARFGVTEALLKETLVGRPLAGRGLRRHLLPAPPLEQPLPRGRRREPRRERASSSASASGSSRGPDGLRLHRGADARLPEARGEDRRGHRRRPVASGPGALPGSRRTSRSAIPVKLRWRTSVPTRSSRS